MPGKTEIVVYYGPLSWFNDKLAGKKRKSLLELVYERDEASRVFTHRVEQQGDNERADATSLKRRRPTHVAAESGDYATLNDHAITSFMNLVRSISPKHLYLHNPPIHVHEQLARVFPLTVESYSYPVISRQTLIDFRDHFAEHLVGQVGVKDSLLAALYPLSRPGRSKPIVLMLYGPSGVGKTESAQFINGLLGGQLMRKQFSMFHNDQFASYVFGGKYSEPAFAHDLLDRESGVILIDEFDKANPIFHSAFYELFDTGVFEDSNYRVTLGPTLIICTSNYGTESDVRKALGDALYSRFDALIQFETLSKAELKEVIDRLVDANLDDLDDEERAQVDAAALRAHLGQLVDKNVGNVRKLSKIVKEAVSILLVRSLLARND